MKIPNDVDTWVTQGAWVSSTATCPICDSHFKDSDLAFVSASQMDVGDELVSFVNYTHLDCIRHEAEKYATAYTEFDELRREALARTVA